MKEYLDHMAHHASLLEAACCDLETAATTMEAERDVLTTESALEYHSYELLEELVDVVCALAKSQAADSRALHQHLWTHYKAGMA